MIQAVVGKKRLDELEEQIRGKVTARMAGGAGELLKSFKLFSSGQGEIGPNQMMQVSAAGGDTVAGMLGGEGAYVDTHRVSLAGAHCLIV